MEEWKTYKIGSLCSISSSKRIFAKEYQSSGIPFYRGKEVIEKQKGETVSTELYISKSMPESPISHTCHTFRNNNFRHKAA